MRNRLVVLGLLGAIALSASSAGAGIIVPPLPCPAPPSLPIADVGACRVVDAANEVIGIIVPPLPCPAPATACRLAQETVDRVFVTVEGLTIPSLPRTPCSSRRGC